MTFNSLKCLALIESLQACFEDALGIMFFLTSCICTRHLTREMVKSKAGGLNQG